jgi:hypothetical protein
LYNIKFYKKEKRKMLKNKRGITLVALVITIIVLLILAGITINLTIGEGGIIQTAQQAGKNYVEAAENEQTQLADFFNQTEGLIGSSVSSGSSDSSGTTNNDTSSNSTIINLGNKTNTVPASTFTWDVSSYEGYANFTVDNFLFVPKTLCVWVYGSISSGYPIYRDMTVSYDNSTGILTLGNCYISKDDGTGQNAAAAEITSVDAYLVK